jgi:hypothetical protein
MVTITGVNDNDAVREIVTISHAISGGGYDTVSMTNFTTQELNCLCEKYTFFGFQFQLIFSLPFKDMS